MRLNVLFAVLVSLIVACGGIEKHRTPESWRDTSITDQGDANVEKKPSLVRVNLLFAEANEQAVYDRTIRWSLLQGDLVVQTANLSAKDQFLTFPVGQQTQQLSFEEKIEGEWRPLAEFDLILDRDRTISIPIQAEAIRMKVAADRTPQKS